MPAIFANFSALENHQALREYRSPSLSSVFNDADEHGRKHGGIGLLENLQSTYGHQEERLPMVSFVPDNLLRNCNEHIQ